METTGIIGGGITGGASRVESPTETGHDYAKERGPTSEPLKCGFPTCWVPVRESLQWGPDGHPHLGVYRGTTALGNTPVGHLNDAMAL